jgi:hypothetical protein
MNIQDYCMKGMRFGLMVVVIGTLVTGCKMKRYDTKWVQFMDTKYSRYQAEETCKPQAEILGDLKAEQARDDYVGTGATGFAGGFLEAANRSSAGKKAYKRIYASAMKACMAEKGWKEDRYCVGNCS